MKIQALIITLLGLIGIGDTVYLVGKQLSEKEIGTCPIFGTGCGDVLHSVYSQFLGIPLSYYGLVFYLGMTTLALLLLWKGQDMVKKLLMLGALTGFLLSIAFIYIQGVLIGAYCFYCVISAITSTLIFFTMLPSIINTVLDYQDSKNESDVLAD